MKKMTLFFFLGWKSYIIYLLVVDAARTYIIREHANNEEAIFGNFSYPQNYDYRSNESYTIASKFVKRKTKTYIMNNSPISSIPLSPVPSLIYSFDQYTKRLYSNKTNSGLVGRSSSLETLSINPWYDDYVSDGSSLWLLLSRFYKNQVSCQKGLPKTCSSGLMALSITSLPLHQNQTKFCPFPQNMASSSCLYSHSWSPVTKKNVVE